VSLYNEAPTGPIYPTPVVGIVGRLPDVNRAGRLGFAAEGDAIALVGPFEASRTGSELAKLGGLAPTGPLPRLDHHAVREAHEQVRAGVRAAKLESAHDIAEGGLAVALAECCIAGGIGASIALPEGVDAFAEAPGQAFIVSGDERDLGKFEIIGRVGGSELAIDGVLRISVSDLEQAWSGGLAAIGT
jgi:phosphoribosylformylglycinamidine synthase